MAEPRISRLIKQLYKSIMNINPTLHSDIKFRPWLNDKPIEEASSSTAFRCFQIHLENPDSKPSMVDSANRKWYKQYLVITLRYGKYINETANVVNEAGNYVLAISDMNDINNIIYSGSAFGDIQGYLRPMPLEIEDRGIERPYDVCRFKTIFQWHEP